MGGLSTASATGAAALGDQPDRLAATTDGAATTDYVGPDESDGNVVRTMFVGSDWTRQDAQLALNVVSTALILYWIVVIEG